MGELTCPKCGLTGKSAIHAKKSIFSPSQRTFKKVVLSTKSGCYNVDQNCCNQCSPNYFICDDDTGKAPTTTASPSGAFKKFADVVTPERFKNRLALLRSLPACFWDDFHGRVCMAGQIDRVQSLSDMLIANWPEAYTSQGALKVMSKFGAVKAHEKIRGAKIYDISGQAYFDPGNETYAFVLQHAWNGKALLGSHITNYETCGDVVEALLGFAWFMFHPENIYRDANTKRHELAYELIQAMHEVIAFTYDHWEGRYQLPW